MNPREADLRAQSVEFRRNRTPGQMHNRRPLQQSKRAAAHRWARRKAQELYREIQRAWV